MTKGKLEPALDTPTLLRILQIAPSKLNYWVAKGFCTPTLDAGHGRRATRYWTVEDLIVLRSIKELRARGCSLQLVALVEARLRTRYKRGIASAVLFYDGSDVLVEDEGTITRLVKDAGQAAFPETLYLAAWALRPWVEEAERHTSMVNIDEIRNRRAAIRARRSA